MTVIDKILCDYGITQPLYYGKENGKYYFLIADIIGQGNITEPRKYLNTPFDEIRPLDNMNGENLIGTRIGNTWKLWRYRYIEDKDKIESIPSEYYLLDSRVLEEINGIAGKSFEECLCKYKG